MSCNINLKNNNFWLEKVMKFCVLSGHDGQNIIKEIWSLLMNISFTFTNISTQTQIHLKETQLSQTELR